MPVRQLDDRSQHTVHRLEAFSDIVMGFCLAQLGLNLVLPRGGGDVASVWASSTFFVGAFLFIALLWWFHHRMFSAYFVLNTPMIVMNFGVLCGLILTLYFFESFMHVVAAGQNPVVFFNVLVFSFAFVYALLGAMLLVGLLMRRNDLPAADLRWGIGQFVTIAISVTFFVAAGTYAALSAHRSWLGYSAIVAAATVFVIRRIIMPRWLRRAIPDPPVSSG